MELRSTAVLVVTSLRRLDAVIIFVNVHPTNAVMVSQV